MVALSPCNLRHYPALNWQSGPQTYFPMVSPANPSPLQLSPAHRAQSTFYNVPFPACQSVCSSKWKQTSIFVLKYDSLREGRNKPPVVIWTQRRGLERSTSFHDIGWSLQHGQSIYTWTQELKLSNTAAQSKIMFWVPEKSDIYCSRGFCWLSLDYSLPYRIWLNIFFLWSLC